MKITNKEVISVFCAQVSAVSELISEATLKYIDNEWVLCALDPANVAMVIWKHITGPLDSTDMFSINMNNLKTVLKRLAVEDELEMEISDNRLIVSAGHRKYSLPLLTEHTELSKEPKLEHVFSAEMDTKQLAQTIADASVFCESISFKYGPKGILFEANGDAEYGSYRNEHTCVGGDATGSSSFSIEYLMKMINPKLGDTCTIKLGDCYPLVVEYPNLKMILAPRDER